MIGVQASCAFAQGRRCNTSTTLMTARNSCTAGICANTKLLLSAPFASVRADVQEHSWVVSAYRVTRLQALICGTLWRAGLERRRDAKLAVGWWSSYREVDVSKGQRQQLGETVQQQRQQRPHRRGPAVHSNAYAICYHNCSDTCLRTRRQGGWEDTQAQLLAGSACTLLPPPYKS